MPENIAVICYQSKHDIDVVFARTRHEPIAPASGYRASGNLPLITNGLLTSIGVFDPDVEGEDPSEEAWYYGVLTPEEIASYPILEDLCPALIAPGACPGPDDRDESDEEE